MPPGEPATGASPRSGRWACFGGRTGRRRGSGAPSRATAYPTGPAYLFRRTFTLDAAPVWARAYVMALGCYELVINGITVGDGLLRPGWTDSHRRVQYQVVDLSLSQHLRAGNNVIGALLAPGWFAGRISSAAAVEDSSHPDVRTPELLVQVEMDQHDGHRFVLGSDESWVWAPSAILSSDLYDGEDWDCRLLRAG